jgi:hypothetical protein
MTGGLRVSSRGMIAGLRSSLRLLDRSLMDRWLFVHGHMVKALVMGA